MYRRKQRPSSDDLDNWWEVGTVHIGTASSLGHELDDEEFEAVRKQREAEVSRKRQPGFTATWPEDKKRKESK